jgi:hypothetical protein
MHFNDQFRKIRVSNAPNKTNMSKHLTFHKNQFHLSVKFILQK